MRLIDADYLNEYIQTHRVDVSVNTVRTEDKELIVMKDGRWESLLNEIPTAYDADKVVKEFEEYDSENIYLDYELAIDIVKRGGVDEV